MLNFRKLFFASAVVAIATTSAFGQQPLSCTAQSSATTSIRAEGVTELTGDILITCTGGTKTPYNQLIPQFNLQIFTQPYTEITSRILGTSSAGAFTEAVLFIDEPISAQQTICGGTVAPLSDANIPVCNQNTGTGTLASPYVNVPLQTHRPNAWVGRRFVQVPATNSSNSLIWQGIQFDPPGTSGSRTIRIKNVRINASLLGVSIGNPVPVAMFISTSQSNTSAGGYTPQPITVPIANQQPTVALAQVTHSFSYGEVSALVCEPNTNPSVNLTWTELVPNAWKQRSQAGAINSTTSLAPVTSDSLQNFYDTETGFYKASSSANWDTSLPAIYGNAVIAGQPGAGAIANPPVLGLADHGLRFIVRLTNVPSQISVTTASGALPITSSLTTTGSARRTASDSNGAGAFTTTGTGITLSGGAGQAVWEVLYTDTSAFEVFQPSLNFSWTIANPPAVGTSVNGRGWYAPFSLEHRASGAGNAIPRFIDLSTPGNPILTVNSCRSNLLYPFITNKAGSSLDTGLEVSNTSRDPFGTAPQSGACTLYYYGQVGANNYYAPSPQPLTKVINGGDHATWSLSSGGDAPALAGFQGYLIARCDFQYAHGFAFISDFGAQKLAMGYLALIFEGPSKILPRVPDKYEAFDN